MILFSQADSSFHITQSRQNLYSITDSSTLYFSSPTCLWNSEKLIMLTAVTTVLDLIISDHVCSLITMKSQVKVSYISLSVFLRTSPGLGIKGKDLDHQCSCLAMAIELIWEDSVSEISVHFSSMTSRLKKKMRKWEWVNNCIFSCYPRVSIEATWLT